MAPYNIPKQPKCFTVAKHFWGSNLCKFVLKWDWVRPGSAFVLVCSVFLLLPRPSQIPAPWITNELCTLKVAGHQLERLSKRTGLTVHRNAYNIYCISYIQKPNATPITKLVSTALLNGPHVHYNGWGQPLPLLFFFFINFKTSSITPILKKPSLNPFWFQ